MKKSFLIAACVAVMGFLSYAFIQPGNGEQYDYATIVFRGDLHISHTGTAFVEVDVKQREMENSFDYTPTLKKVQEYEAQGWEMVQNNMTYSGGDIGKGVLYFLMRKRK